MGAGTGVATFLKWAEQMLPLAEGSSCSPGWQGFGHANPGAVGRRTWPWSDRALRRGTWVPGWGVCGTPALADGRLSSPSLPFPPAPTPG